MPRLSFPVPLSPVTTGVSALEVYTPKEIFVANGTQGKLTCKFKSTNTTGTLTTVSWSFQPEGADTTVSVGVFHCSWRVLPHRLLPWGRVISDLFFWLFTSKPSDFGICDRLQGPSLASDSPGKNKFGISTRRSFPWACGLLSPCHHRPNFSTVTSHFRIDLFHRAALSDLLALITIYPACVQPPPAPFYSYFF